ncbi:glycosyltransferase family 2 protein [Empedobacter falsenii]
MDISIIIVNYNTYELLKACINSIIKYTVNIDYEIIVVDNNSPERDIDQIELEYNNIRLIRNTNNSGFGSANNIGANFAKGKYLFFLNPDTIFLNNALLYFLEFSNKLNNPFGVLGSVLLSENLQINASYSEKFTTYSEELLMGIFSILYKKRDSRLKEKYKEVAWVSGANIFIQKNLFDEIKGFDENYFMYYEETDLQRRLKNKKFNNYVIKGPRIIHLEGGGNGKINLNKKRIIDKSKFYYYKKFSNQLEYKLISKLYQYLTFLKISLDYNIYEAKKYHKFISDNL